MALQDAASTVGAVGAAKEGIPRLYIYDHCPFCVRARMVLGLKGVKHELFFLANDDVETPTALVGKKVGCSFKARTKTPSGGAYSGDKPRHAQ
jgi:hypothetical protein